MASRKETQFILLRLWEIGFGLRRPAVRRVVGMGDDCNLDMKLMYHYDLSFVSINPLDTELNPICQ